MSVSYALEIPTQLIVWQYDPKAWAHTTMDEVKAYYHWSPPKATLSALKEADFIIGASSLAFVRWFSYTRSEILGTSRLIWIKGAEDFILRMAGPEIDIKKVQRRGKIMDKMFRKGRKMKIMSPQGTNITIDGLRNSCTNFVRGEVFKAGDESSFPGGYCYVQTEKNLVNGTIVLDGAMKAPFGVLTEPIKLTIEKDKIIKVEGGRQARQFQRFIEELNDPNFPIIEHIGIGVNPGAMQTWNMWESEAQEGVVSFGVGRKQYWFERKEHLYTKKNGMQAITHYDPSIMEGTLWLDDELLIKDGEFVHPELK